jgi:hypothetical protein
MAGRPTAGESTKRYPEVGERRASQRRAARIARGREARIHVGRQTPSDSCFRLHNLGGNCRRSAGRASDCLEGSELWMEFVSPSSDRWKNRLRHRGVASLDCVLDIGNTLVRELNQTDISCHSLLFLSLVGVAT